MGTARIFLLGAVFIIVLSSFAAADWFGYVTGFAVSTPCGDEYAIVLNQGCPNSALRTARQ